MNAIKGATKNRSLPLRERGLKSGIHIEAKRTERSLPLRERGLKCEEIQEYEWKAMVAPLAGAWIEINFTVEFKGV